MWQTVLAGLAEWAPYAGVTAVASVIFAFFVLQIAKLRLRVLNLMLGSGLALGGLVFGASIVALYLGDLAATVSSNHSAFGVLMIYGVAWPILMVTLGVAIACIGAGRERLSE